ncbi:hypothetical protein J1N35_040565 [Gossypium stocksii]|uniref:Uncharacterized protein n=1 Tax=Gossypium stocksii TaxID=47602 RepID=A0A9D3UDT5_9ROSI|nr:hypothetical protein J1N35_040565 [Gossypium stocksii]
MLLDKGFQLTGNKDADAPAFIQEVVNERGWKDVDDLISYTTYRPNLKKPNPTTFGTNLEELSEERMIRDALKIPITRARAKKMEESFIGLIQHLLAEPNPFSNYLAPVKDPGSCNLLHVMN